MAEWIVVPEGFYDDAKALQTWATKAHGVAPANLKKKAAPAIATKKKEAPAKKRR